MADPLSVAASVVGIISAAAKISSGLAGIVKKAQNAPSECQKLQLEVDEVQTILGQLQQFLLGTQRAPRSRMSLIIVDQVITTLAACVTTFSELDTFTDALQSESNLNLLDRLRWASKESELKAILTRIGSHKSSLNIMLTILTCQKQEEAEAQVDQLCQLIQKVLESNTFLATRLESLEEMPPGVPNRTTVGTVTIDAHRAVQNLNRDDPGDHQISRGETPTRDKRGFAFEEVLMNSRPYRNISLDYSDVFSILSSAGRTASWSMLSGLSLSEISHIGILAIPIYESDIANKEAYNFNLPTLESSSLTPKTMAVPGQRRRFPQQKLQAGHQAGGGDLLVPVLIRKSILCANKTTRLIDETGTSYCHVSVPMVVREVGAFIKEKGTDVEDIFAHSGNPARVMQLQFAFDEPPDHGRGLSWDDYTVYDAATVLQRYLKTLPEPIIPYDMYDSFVNRLGPIRGATTKGPVRMISTTKVLIEALPDLNRQLLLYILDLLAVLSNKSDVNKMTQEGLTAAFQPAILSAPEAKMDVAAYFNAARVVVFLINKQQNAQAFCSEGYEYINIYA